jgi:hypothetical protein
MLRHLYCKLTLLFVNKEACATTLKHYTIRFTNINYLNRFKELYINFRVNAFAYNTVNLSQAHSIRDNIANNIAKNITNNILTQKSF